MMKMEEHVIVDSSFSAVINAPLEKIDIPVWCFSLPDEENQGCSSAQGGASRVLCIASSVSYRRLRKLGAHRLLA